MLQCLCCEKLQSKRGLNSTQLSDKPCLVCTLVLVASSSSGRLFPPSSTTPTSPQPTAALRNPPATASPPNRAEPRHHQIGRPWRSSRVWKNRGRHRQKRRTSRRQAVVAKSSAPAAAAGVSAMITRSKLVEQLRDYQIRSQHK